jgi:uncharacterized membrane protein
MASAGTQRRSSAARRARPATSKNGRNGSKNGRNAAQRAIQAVELGGSSAGSRIAKAAAAKTLRAVGRKALHSAARAVRLAADRTASAGRDAVEAGMSNRPPIQLSIDVAVPLEVAWEEWMKLDSIPEGVHRIEEVERDGDSLFGCAAGARSGEWEAEIVDEREQQSFAWRSVQGSDCVGLVTFHRLSDRLTRIELDLDVLPTNPAEALKLASHLAHRRAKTDVRRFKAHVEFISPDVYETNSS